ncbi:type VI secretion system-associated protein TagO [Hoeflea sp.]|uniref:type VI secretion system-associated protein TagO n=1 Tax=Hoeflea sp. TaxID=1940281 RepID=UPI0019CB0369|nr:type VI secretion system-associated protein TagO [Hoeflea sp.]MBC7280010.1 hypothetical protein [Hoeflea sp.]
MRAVVWFVIAGLLGCWEARAQEAENACIGIENALDRLACYDRLSGRTPKVSALPSAAGSWDVTQTTSKLTDDRNVTMTVDTGAPVQCGRVTAAPVTLVIRCMENRTALYFSTECHMTSSDYNSYGHVDMRLDDDKAFTSRMNESTDSRALGLWQGSASIPVIKKMFGKQRLIARMTPYGRSAMTVEMDIAGLQDQIKPLREACGW